MKNKMKIRSVKSWGMVKIAAFYTVFCAAFTALAQAGTVQKAEELEPFIYEIPAEATMNEVKDRRNVLETNIFQLVRMGDKFYKGFQYQKAFDAYEQALKVFDRQNLGRSNYIEMLKARIQKRSRAAHKGWAEAEFRKARLIYTKAMSNGANEEAIERYQQAKNIAYRAFGIYYYRNPGNFNRDRMRNDSVKDPGFYDKITAFQADCDKMVNAVRFQIDTSLETIDPDNKDRRKRIMDNLRRARIYYRQKKYEKVRELVEKILREDNYNEAAINLLEKAYQKLYKIAAMRRQVDAEQKVLDIDWKWVEAYPESGGEELQEVSGEAKGMEDSAIAANIGKNNLAFYKKLKGIILPQLEYSQDTIENIAKDLSDRSTAHNKGMRIEIIPDSNIKDRRINSLALNQASLWVWLKYLCRLGKISFYLDGNHVVLSKGGNAIETQSHPISILYADHIREEIGGGTGEAKKEKEEVDFDEELGDLSDTRDENKDLRKNINKSIDPEKLKGYFQERGVPFPEGSSISYDPESSSLTMRNTTANHDKLSDRIRVLDKERAMVMVEAKILEISMAAMEELGFDWTFTYDTSRNSKRFITSSGMFPAGQVYSRASEASNVLINNLSLLPNVGGNLNANLFLTIRAVDTSERAELITMPRVTVLSDNPATLNIGDERSFPSDYEEATIEISDNGNSVIYNPPNPDFESEPLGLDFSVKPTVMNHKTIDIDFNTSLKKFVGWSNYDYTIKIGRRFESIADNSAENLNPKQKMADIAERRIQTRIQIYDGESVVIGGVIQDETVKVDDKYPLLGDLPLIGRLFTDRSSSHVKSNMMIYVTARIMRSDGLPDKQERRNDGLFNFINR